MAQCATTAITAYVTGSAIQELLSKVRATDTLALNGVAGTGATAARAATACGTGTATREFIRKVIASPGTR